MSKSSTGTRNKPHRRCLTFSLRTLFVLLTALAVWLGIIVNRAREQREAVEAIEALGGTVRYDWQPTREEEFSRTDDVGFTSSSNPKPDRSWLRDLTQQADEAGFVSRRPMPESVILKSIPFLKRLRTLRRVEIWRTVSPRTQNELKAALPNCEVSLTDVNG